MQKVQKRDSEFTLKQDSIVELISNENFHELPNDIQKEVLNSMKNTDSKDGGFMGKFFGNKKENAALNIAFTVCLLLVIVGIICMEMGNDQWNIIITGIMTIVGYIFGRSSIDLK